MTIHTPVPPRIIALGGPVTRALAAMRAVEPETDRTRLLALRKAIADRIEADIALLDALAGDPDFEQDAGDMPEIDAGDEPEGVRYGLHDATEDDEPSLGSLCGTSHITAMSQAAWAGGGADDCEAGDDNGIADDGGMQEQMLRDELVAA